MEKSLIRPSFVTQFSCIGSECEDSCCYGWDIHIDKQSYKKTLANPDLKGLAQTALKKVKRSEQAWAKAVLNQEGACGFLDGNKLCQIHAKAGESLLSHTCRTYPRMSHMKDGDRYESLSLSCPEAARVILIKPDAFHFERMSVRHNNEFDSTPLWAQKAHDYSIQLLLNNKLAISHSLTAIGILMKTVESVKAQQQDSSHIDAMFRQLESLGDRGELQQHVAGFNQDTELQKKHAFTSIHLWLNTNKPVRGRARFELINQAVCRVVDEEGNFSVKQLNNAWLQHALPALEKHEDLFNRYLFYYFYHMNFPQVDKLSPTEAFRVMMVDYFMLRCYLAAMAADKQGLTEHDIIMCFQVYHTSRQHKANYSQYVVDLLDKCHFDDLATILTLLA
ncbi:Flagellar biosynthesis protein, putative [Shewanella piezotolerans WP3]|uniref:Flagellar biosynthesis protein, putative n=1 Tax=Shewanella piezotolerans (strain WP3 / JCM 13877) TaxID=225849 RepID=B8CVQ6_SHEPW|nr:flagellin lysine-N-methylase [Shewanella piezotolerans]ACJ31732.1 Flagellar biosynthesis protein, putative [Shewanella piezotolerans WP3]